MNERNDFDNRLDRAVEIVRGNPTITNEQLASQLGLKRPASASFWRIKALLMLDLLPARNRGGKQ